MTGRNGTDGPWCYNCGPLCDHGPYGGMPQFYDPLLLRRWGLRRLAQPTREQRMAADRQRWIAENEHGMRVPPTTEVYAQAGSVDEFRDSDGEQGPVE